MQLISAELQHDYFLGSRRGVYYVPGNFNATLNLSLHHHASNMPALARSNGYGEGDPAHTLVQF